MGNSLKHDKNVIFFLSHGAFIRWGFYSLGLLSGGDFIRRGFYPLGLLSVGAFVRWAYPQGFCPTLHVTYTQYAKIRFFANWLADLRKGGCTS